MKCFIFILIILSNSELLAQSTTHHPSLSLKNNSFSEVKSSISTIDVHLGAGFVPGGRIGLRYLFNKNFSAEIAYGADFRNFFGATEADTRYTFGINYHFNQSIAAISIITTYVDHTSKAYNSFLVSPNFGFIPIRKSGFQVFIRAGVYFEFQNNNSSDKWKLEDFGGNIDVGISYNFQFLSTLF
jgi:hypothetical protein